MDLKKILVNNPFAEYPVPIRGRTGHMLPQKVNTLQYKVSEVKNIQPQSEDNAEPTESQNHDILYIIETDVLLQISSEAGENLDVVEENKILGYVLRSDPKTISNTEYIYARKLTIKCG